MSANNRVWLDDLFMLYVKDYGRGRVCAHDGCGTVLSRYNPIGYCVCHEADADDVLFGETKQCIKCGRELPRDDVAFGVNRSHKDGLMNECRACRAERGRINYRRNIEVNRAKSAEYERQRKARKRAERMGVAS